mmetsp:Transcript_6642/g.18583  ORF Transcript_6642/g.18583 Transcript_6642/m.18583 type:complete len:91 (-) Transcript_6642:44-316(-)
MMKLGTLSYLLDFGGRILVLVWEEIHFFDWDDDDDCCTSRIRRFPADSFYFAQQRMNDEDSTSRVANGTSSRPRVQILFYTEGSSDSVVL